MRSTNHCGSCIVAPVVKKLHSTKMVSYGTVTCNKIVNSRWSCGTSRLRNMKEEKRNQNEMKWKLWSTRHPAPKVLHVHNDWLAVACYLWTKAKKRTSRESRLTKSVQDSATCLIAEGGQDAFFSLNVKLLCSVQECRGFGETHVLDILLSKSIVQFALIEMQWLRA